MFARSEYAEPLAERGDLEAAGPEEARKRALERFGAGWVELALVPESAVSWILVAEEAEHGDVAAARA